MADLSTLVVTDPPDGEAVSSGASRIRATRDSVVTSFDVEHALTGPHTFKYGAPGTRPTVGNAGRIWFDTTNERIERDDGAAWRMLHGVQIYNQSVVGSLTLTASYQVLATVTIDVVLDGRILVFGSFQATNTSGSAAGVGYKLAIDGTTVLPGEYLPSIPAGHTHNLLAIGILFGASTASHTVTLQAINTGFSAGLRNLTVAIA